MCSLSLPLPQYFVKGNAFKVSIGTLNIITTNALFFPYKFNSCLRFIELVGQNYTILAFCPKTIRDIHSSMGN